MASIEQKFTLHVPSSTQNLAIIREFVTNVGVQAGLGEDDVAKLELAVDEACTNVIEHAHGGDITKDVVVRATFDEKTLRIEVVDSGAGFDPACIPEDGVERLVAQRRSGGLGLRVMRSLMDEVSYEIVPGNTNRLRMTKRLRKD
jgi:serine/threonine-protein kinase RsbW